MAVETLNTAFILPMNEQTYKLLDKSLRLCKVILEFPDPDYAPLGKPLDISPYLCRRIVRGILPLFDKNNAKRMVLSIELSTESYSFLCSTAISVYSTIAHP
jgi:hypothetical protein